MCLRTHTHTVPCNELSMPATACGRKLIQGWSCFQLSTYLNTTKMDMNGHILLNRAICFHIHDASILPRPHENFNPNEDNFPVLSKLAKARVLANPRRKQFNHYKNLSSCPFSPMWVTGKNAGTERTEAGRQEP